MSTEGGYICVAGDMPSEPMQFEFCSESVSFTKQYCFNVVFFFVAVPIIKVVNFTLSPQLGNSFFIECVYDGTPLPSVTWMKDGAILNPAEDNVQIMSKLITNSSRIEISNANSDFDGNYTCIATNDAGNGSDSHLIILQGYSCNL